MAQYSVTYGFVQRFPFPAKEVYDWCVDYKSDDWALMGEEGKRKVDRLDNSTIMLYDTVVKDGKPQSKTRLVKLYPELLIWTNTRISAKGRHSQFIYRIIPEGEKKSRLEFTGAQVEKAKRKPSTSKIAAENAENARVDSALWVHLAKEMKKDLGGRS